MQNVVSFLICTLFYVKAKYMRLVSYLYIFFFHVHRKDTRIYKTIYYVDLKENIETII